MFTENWLYLFVVSKIVSEDEGKDSRPGIRSKIMKWCAWQDRSQHETRHKLYQLGMNAEDTESLIADLIGENFLNEERFANNYAGGKFRMKKWGRIKIAMGLQKHSIPENLIVAALDKINEEDYDQALHILISKKQQLVKGYGPAKARQLVVSFAASKGFEYEKIYRFISE